MKPQYRDPDFFTFPLLANKLGITQIQIEIDFKTGKIKQFLIDNLYRKARPNTRKRITKLMPILNKYAREHIHEGPTRILNNYNTELININKTQKSILIDNIKSDSIFEMWLKEYGIDINNIRLVIPRDEAAIYEKYLKYDTDKISAIKDQDSFDARKYIETCLSNGKNPDEIAIELVEIYGTNKEKYYGVIGRMLAGYDEKGHFSNVTWRQRGYRFYKKVKSIT